MEQYSHFENSARNGSSESDEGESASETKNTFTYYLPQSQTDFHHGCFTMKTTTSMFPQNVDLLLCFLTELTNCESE